MKFRTAFKSAKFDDPRSGLIDDFRGREEVDRKKIAPVSANMPADGKPGRCEPNVVWAISEKSFSASP